MVCFAIVWFFTHSQASKQGSLAFQHFW